jgi:hypothetical protein
MFQHPQVFDTEVVGSTLVLTYRTAFQHRAYASLQHEYNTVFALLGESVNSLLFDMVDAPPLDSVVLGMLVGLTHRIRDLNGDAAMCGLSVNAIESLQSLMLLQDKAKRARWHQFPDRNSALLGLRVLATPVRAGLA